jgi:hypothetical protein
MSLRHEYSPSSGFEQSHVNPPQREMSDHPVYYHSSGYTPSLQDAHATVEKNFSTMMWLTGFLLFLAILALIIIMRDTHRNFKKYCTARDPKDRPTYTDGRWEWDSSTNSD